MEDQGQGVSATAGKGNQGDTTYRQVIRWSEDQMAEWGNRITVTIVATPALRRKVQARNRRP